MAGGAGTPGILGAKTSRAHGAGDGGIHNTLYRHMLADGSAVTNTLSVSLADGHGLGSLRSCHAPRP